MDAGRRTTLALVIFLAWTAAGRAQDAAPLGPELNPNPPAGQFVSTAMLAEDKRADDLNCRVAALEAALKKAQDKETADKKKADEKPTVVVGGRVFLDTVFFGQSQASKDNLALLTTQNGDGQDSAFFRAAWIAIEGDMFQIMSYKAEFDLAARSDLTPAATNDQGFVEQVGFKDVYMQIRDLPLLGTLRVGHFKEPFSLEQQISSKFTTFMERSLPDALVPQYNMGVMAMDWNEAETATWAYGVFRDDPNENPPYESDDNGGWAWTMRGTWLPWYDEATQGRGLLHLGMGYRYLNNDTTAVRFRSRPETGVGPRIVDTGALADASDLNELAPELAFVYGPFSVQSEYIVAYVNRTAAPDATFNGMYVYASYFLTGENRYYQRQAGRFDRVRPYENFFRVRDCDGCVQTGKGAWELAYRYSNLDLNDAGAGVLGGYGSDHTLGVNWYLNPYSRLMFNYVHSNTDFVRFGLPRDAALDVYEMRAQFDF